MGRTAGVTIGLEDQTSGRYRGSEGKVASSFASFLVLSHHDTPKSPDENYKLLPAFCLGEDSRRSLIWVGRLISNPLSVLEEWLPTPPHSSHTGLSILMRMN